nr:integrase, catalytic region, zinc finger, CCHC-type, peptidase aspartic, catalytic [Tanacetum cinerariifolium]
EQALVITALKEELRNLKGKAVVETAGTSPTIAPKMYEIDVQPLASRLLHNRMVHSEYLRQTCPSIHKSSANLVAANPKNKDKKVRFSVGATSSGNKNTKPASSSNIVSNKPLLSSAGVNTTISASRSQPTCNTKKDRIWQTPRFATVQQSKRNMNSNVTCGKVWKPTSKVFNKIGYIWRPTGQTFTIVGNAYPLTRITKTTEVPLRKPIALENDTSKPVVTLIYSRKPRRSKTSVPASKSKINKSVVQIILWYLDSGCSKHMTVDRSQLTNFVSKLLGTVKFRNDHVAKIMGFNDYQIGNVTISRVYSVEGLDHNLFSVGQLCDSNLEVAFHQHTSYVRNLEGVDLLSGCRGNNLYTLSLGDMMASFPICFLSKASNTKSWLWHHCLSHLNIGAINHLAVGNGSLSFVCLIPALSAVMTSLSFWKVPVDKVPMLRVHHQ